MAVAFDAVGPSSGVGASGASATSLSWSHTCTGSNLYLVVGVCSADPTYDSALTVKYNSVSMTSLGHIQSNNSNAGGVLLFGLASPSTGANTVLVTPGVTADLIGGSMSFTGVGSVGTAVTNFGSGTGAIITVSVTGVSSTSLVPAVCCFGSPIGSMTAGTQEYSANLNGNSGAGDGAGGYNSGSGTVTNTWTSVNNDWFGTIGVELKAVSSGGLSSLLNPASTNRARLTRPVNY